MLRPNQLAGTDQVLFERVDNGAVVNLLTVNQELAAGDVLLLRVKGSTIEAWRHDGSSWSRLGTIVRLHLRGIGFAGVGMRGTTGRADDFGARTTSQSPPGAPTALSATRRSDASATLSWTAPTLRRRLARLGLQGLSRHEPGPDDGGPPRSARRRRYPDSGLDERHHLLLQGVRAQRQRREARSPTQASATPSGLVAPLEPLPTVDCLRPREREPALRRRALDERRSTARSRPGLYTHSNQLACTKTTTCTAWRNAAPVRPRRRGLGAPLDAARSTDNQLRLLRAHPAAGHLEPTTATCCAPTSSREPTRFSSSGSTTARSSTSLTSTRSLPPATSSSCASRARPSRPGATTARPGRASGRRPDSTYAGTGCAGVGMRGTTGRADDFGARTIRCAAARHRAARAHPAR